MLTATQIDAFGRDGFLVVPGFFDPSPTAQLRQWTDEVIHYPETPGQHMMYFEPSLLVPGQRLLCRVENFVPFHQGFADICLGPLAVAVSDLLGEKAILFKDKINCKLSGGDGFKPHQDMQAGWDVYGSIHVTAMVSIDASDEGNGRLEMVAGRHREGLLGPMWEPLPPEAVDQMVFEPVDTQPGDAIFFDSFAPHRSGPNSSGRDRRILYVTYGKASEGDQRSRYYADKRAAFPPDCERDPLKTYTFKV